MALSRRFSRPDRDPDHADSSRRRVLDLLGAAGGPLTITEITSGTGLHANTVRSHLALLTEMGRVEAVPEERTRPGRPKLLYRAVPHGAPTDPYRVLAQELAAGLADGEPGTTPGVAAGHRLARNQRAKVAADGAEVTPADSITMAVEGLEVLGFETTTDPLGDRLYLSSCPFADLAREDRAICRLHHEMLNGFFGELDSGVTVRRLDIFVRDDLCVAHLNRPDLRPAPEPIPAHDAPRPWEQ
jgi:predicted ArsR family transcriptional regulator